jgi:hypothetical protein
MTDFSTSAEGSGEACLLSKGIPTADQSTRPKANLIQYINLKLAALGCPTLEVHDTTGFEEMDALLAHQREINRLLANHLCPADNRIQTFLYDYLQDAPLAKLPARTFALDRYGLARFLSLPPTRDEFASDIVHSYRVEQGVLHNGVPAHELKCDNRRLVTNYLRVGYDQDGSWRTFGLRKDFHPASKLAFEDDITASITVPTRVLENLGPEHQQPSVKFVMNCEKRLFQRPDDAVHPGYDKQTEADFARPGQFFLKLRGASGGARRGFNRGCNRLRQIYPTAATTHPRGGDG